MSESVKKKRLRTAKEADDAVTRARVRDILKDQYYIVLTTFRKNGQGVTTPMWFALKDGKLLLCTFEKFWKFKRMKNNPNVEFAPAKARMGSSKYTVVGKTIIGVARFLEGEEAEEANRLLRKKYGFFKYTLSFNLISLVSGNIVYFEITPLEVLDR